MDFGDVAKLDTHDVFKKLGTSEKGLTESEASRRITKYG